MIRGSNALQVMLNPKIRNYGEELQSVIDNLACPFAIVEVIKNDEVTDFVCTYINKSGLDYIRLAEEEVIGKKLKEIFPDNAETLLKVCSQVIKDKITHKAQLTYSIKSGKRKGKKAFDVSISKLNNGVTLSWKDKESTIKNESRLKKKIDSLNKRNIELTREFEEERSSLNKALEELSEAKEFYRIMGEALPYGIWMCDAEGKARYMSQSFLDLLEMSLEEAQEFGWAHRLPPEDVKHMFDAWLYCVKTGTDWDSEHRLLGPDGKYHTILTRGKPVKDKDGKILSWVGINLDIDDRKKMEEDLKQQKYLLQLVLESLPVGVWILNEKGKTINTNKALSNIWGDILPQMYGEHGTYKGYWYKTNKLISKDEWASTRAIRNGETSLNEMITIEAPDGTRKTILNSAVPILNNEQKIIGAVVVNQDVTEERKYAEGLEEIDRAKTIFFSNISHEFRTPLTLILGPLGELLQNGSNLTEAERFQIEMIHRNALRLLKLVNTLMDFSRIEAGRVQAIFEPVDLAAYTTELASVFRSAIERAGMKLIVNTPTITEAVYLDKDMWEKIVLNLLSNAFKYSLKGEIEILLEQKETSVQLKVRDTGIGIPKEDLPHLFERFYRIKGAKGRSEEGTGIGLSLLYELVKIHSGKVHVESTPGVGTTFVVEIPLGKEHIPPEKISQKNRFDSTAIGTSPFIEEALRWLPDEKSSDNSFNDIGQNTSISKVQLNEIINGEEELIEKSKVLIVDDNADMRNYLKRLLSENFIIIDASNGKVALEIIKDEKPDIVLTDVIMPEMDGFELLQNIRSNPELKTLPLIMLTARAGEESRIEGLEAGADAYLVKPFSARELLTYVKAYLEMSRLRAKAAINEEIAQKEKSLRLAERKFKAFFENVQENVVLVEAVRDRQGVIVDWVYKEANESVAKDINFGAGIIGKYVSKLLDDKTFTQVMSDWKHVLETGEPLRYESNFKDNYYLVTYARIADNMLAGTALDLTERKKAEDALKESKAKLLDAQKLAHLGNYTLDVKTGEIQWSEQMYDLWEIDKNKPIPPFKELWNLIHADDREHLDKVLSEGTKNNSQIETEFRILFPNNRIKYIHLITRGFFDESGNLIKRQGVEIDITERKEAMLNLERTLKELELSNRDIEQYAYVTSHDLKEPIRMVTSYAQLLEKKYKSKLGHRADVYLNFIHEGASRLYLLINDLVNYLQIGVTERNFVQVNVNKIIDSVLVTLDEMLKESRTNIKYNELPVITADPQQMKQLFYNLIDNALKFRSNNEPVIEIKCREDEIEWLFSIKDNGIGFKQEYSEIIFSVFQRLNSREDYKGNGVGLAICKRIIGHHNGRIWVESEPGAGSVFYFTIPKT